MPIVNYSLSCVFTAQNERLTQDFKCMDDLHGSHRRNHADVLSFVISIDIVDFEVESCNIIGRPRIDCKSFVRMDLKVLCEQDLLKSYSPNHD